MGIVDNIKSDVKKSGSNKGKFIYFREGQKQRVRFLQDMDDGIEVTFHDSYERGINVPCQSHFGKSCPYCDDEDIRTRSQYIWSVWNYETSEVQLFMYPVNNCSPIPALMAMYENYGTITDRDYVISVSGKQQNKTFSVVPMDKVKFRNTKAKAYSESSVMKMLNKAWPCDDADEEEDEERPVKKRSKASKKSKQQEEDWGDELPDKEELEEMTAVKLYNLCKERDIVVKPRKSESYYISALEEWRKENESESDYDESEDWGDDEDEAEEDYSDKSPQELYVLCKERGIDVPKRKTATFYIRQLEEYDKAGDDWGDDEEEWEDEDGELPFS